MAAAGSQLAAILGDKQIGDAVKNFDFSKMSTKDVTKNDYLHLNLAPSYGTLTSEAMKGMDEQLKIMIAGTMTDLAKVPVEERSFEKVLSVMMQNPLLEPMDDGIVDKSDKIVKNSSADFKTDGSANAGIVREVKSWFTSLISDSDVLNSTQIDIDVLAKIVAQTGATVSSFEAFFAKHEYHEKTMIDIGVLRFPDIDNPFFKLYRIKLVAWSDSSRILFHQDDKNGMTGEYNARKFRPRDSIMSQLKEETRKKAVQEAENLFK